LGIAEQTFYRWRREYGGLKVEQAKRGQVNMVQRIGRQASGYRHFCLQPLGFQLPLLHF
jgi:hypothetical protein